MVGLVCSECGSHPERHIPSAWKAEINGACLYNFRTRKWWTQRELAEILITSPQNVSHYEREVGRPTVWMLRLLCEQTNTPLRKMIEILKVAALWPSHKIRIKIEDALGEEPHS